MYLLFGQWPKEVSSCKMWIINKICSVQTWDSFLFFKLIRTSLRISTREMQAIFFATFIKFNPNFHQKSLEMPKSLIISKYTKKFTSKFQFHSISRFFLKVSHHTRISPCKQISFKLHQIWSNFQNPNKTKTYRIASFPWVQIFFNKNHNCYLLASKISS